MAKKKVGYLHLIGATCIGKGFTTRLLNAYLQLHYKMELGLICIGDLVRERFIHDEVFRGKYQESVAAGNLVPDIEIIPMFDTQLNLVRNDHRFCLDDGFCRTPKQVEHAEAMGTLSPGSAAIIMHGSERICHTRAIDRQNRNGGKRLDEGSFKRRFDLHQRTIDKIHSALQRTGTRIIHLDANGDLEQVVFPDVSAVVECVLSGQFVPAQTNLIQQAFADNVKRKQARTPKPAHMDTSTPVPAMESSDNTFQTPPRAFAGALPGQVMAPQ